MKHKLLIVLAGILFLILLSWLGTSLTEILPARPSASVQTASTGPYQITLRLDPNPPPVARPATLTLQIVHSRTHQLVTNAHVRLESNMEAMDMGTDVVSAQLQGSGMYVAAIQFAMDGTWQIRVVVVVSGEKAESVTFEVVAH